MHCELTDLGLIKIQGKDASKFLQGQLSCNLDAITQGKSSMGAHCNREGRVISLFNLFQWDQAYYLLLQNEMIPVLLSSLKKYSVFFKVEMSDVSNQWKIIGIPGSSTNANLICIPVSANYSVLIGEAEAISPLQTQAITLEHWKRLMIDEGLPTIYPETTGKFLAHELNLDKLNALDFNKGCYTGQEIIARMHYRGKLKTHLFQAEISPEFQAKPGEDIYTLLNNEWKSSGMVVASSREVYNNKCHLLIIANENDQDLYLSKDMKAEIKITGKHHVKEN